jgi:hypothetical protein
MELDLDQPPAERWDRLRDRATAARALLREYSTDLGALGSAFPLIEEAAGEVLSDDLRAELAGIAGVLEAPLAEVLLCNLYYDLLKSGLGCSAFALDRDDGPLHARNLDWWSAAGGLRDESVVCDFRRGGRTRFRSIGWPAFAGCFSGVAPGRFAVTLNAVLSDEPFLLAEPVVFLLRRVLDTAPDFASALATLREAPIASDCLLLLTGVRQGELVVIERTPRRSAVRGPTNGVLVVTNDYRVLGGRPLQGALAESSCDRAARLRELLEGGASDPWRVLADGRVRMGMTVQHMVLQASTGRCELRLPSPS